MKRSQAGKGGNRPETEDREGEKRRLGGRSVIADGRSASAVRPASTYASAYAPTGATVVTEGYPPSPRLPSFAKATEGKRRAERRTHRRYATVGKARRRGERALGGSRCPERMGSAESLLDATRCTERHP